MMILLAYMLDDVIIAKLVIEHIIEIEKIY